MKVVRCKTCGLSENFPRANFQAGICRFCRNAQINNRTNQKLSLVELEKAVTDLLEKHSSNGILVALSGGKDSCYTLEILRNRFQIDCVAMLLDNGYTSDNAKKNCELICDITKTDFITVRVPKPDMDSYYKNALNKDIPSDTPFLQRASALCNGCIKMVNNRALTLANQFNYKVVAGGYIQGQIPSGQFYYELSKEFLERQINGISGNSEIHNNMVMMSPLVALDYNEKQILEFLTSKGWKRSQDTGAHSSNCQINDLGILNHVERYGFHPYEAELTTQVRNGQMSRTEAISRIETEIDLNRVEIIRTKLNN